MLRKLFCAPAGLLLIAAGCSGNAAVPANAQTVAAAVSAESATDDALTIGSVAPALDIEHWVQNGEGQFEPVTKFVNDQVYVVEFWATWCPPCVASMPHLSKLQQDYAKRGVTIISISDEPLETVTTFLEREADGQTNDEGEPLTFDDITKFYCLTTDPDRSTSIDYMEAAGQNGIPCAFIVGKDGHIEWIGHPMQIDDALEQVVSDSWDREAFGEQFRAKQLFDIAMQEVLVLVRSGNVAAAQAKVDELLASAPGPEMKARANQLKIQLSFFAFQSNVANDQQAAAKQLSEVIELVGGAERAVNMLTWTVVQQGEKGDVAPELLTAAVAEAEKLLDAGTASASLIDTLAHLVHMQGDLDRAIELAETAAKDADGQLKESVDAYLEQLRAEKAGDGEASSEEPEADDAE